jgi:hypothetical protein
MPDSKLLAISAAYAAPTSDLKECPPGGAQTWPKGLAWVRGHLKECPKPQAKVKTQGKLRGAGSQPFGWLGWGGVRGYLKECPKLPSLRESHA